MKNMIKYIVVALTTVSFSVAQAGVLEITGSAKASYSKTGSDGTAGAIEQGAGLGVSNEFSLGAAGELDNGYTWTYAVDIDGTTVQDDSKLTLTTPYGTAGVFISEGGLDADNSASQSVMSRPSDTSYSEGMFDSFDLSGTNTIQLHTPAGLLPFETKLRVAYAPNNSTAAINDVKATGAVNTGLMTNNTSTAIAQTSRMGSSAMHYRLDTVPTAGMTFGADYVDFDNVKGANPTKQALNQQPESGSVFATYAFGIATVGLSKSYTAFALDATNGNDLIESVEATKMSVAVNVNDNLSISIEQEASEPRNQASASVASFEMKAQGIQAAYTMGGMTFAVARNEFENASYLENKDVNDTVLTVAMAF